MKPEEVRVFWSKRTILSTVINFHFQKPAISQKSLKLRQFGRFQNEKLCPCEVYKPFEGVKGSFSPKSVLIHLGFEMPFGDIVTEVILKTELASFFGIEGTIGI